MYLGTLRCVAELSAGARIDEPEQQTGYLKHRVRVHTELAEAIIDGDVDRTVAAVARHRGLGGPAAG